MNRAGDITARQLRRFDHEIRRREFRSRQRYLAAVGAWCLVLSILGPSMLAAIAVAMFQTAADEARRYRRTGNALQSRRSIWKGTTPIDAAARPLLGAWRYPGAA